MAGLPTARPGWCRRACMIRSGRMPRCWPPARTMPLRPRCCNTCGATRRARSSVPTAMVSDADLTAIGLTLRLAATTMVLLLLLCTPLAWWLAHTPSRGRGPVSAGVALPLVLPPTVIGFYLLLALGPHGPLGQFSQWLGRGHLPVRFCRLVHAPPLFSLRLALGPHGRLGQCSQWLGWGHLPFSFGGLVLGSLVYSLPFAVQPLQHAFEALGQRPLEAAATLGAGPLDRFFSVALPLARTGFITAAILSFAHTVGEFGVVLMLGGNIPGVTRVVSVQIYDHVEALEYPQAHGLAAGMVLFSFVVLLGLNLARRRVAGPAPWWEGGVWGWMWMWAWAGGVGGPCSALRAAARPVACARWPDSCARSRAACWSMATSGRTTRCASGAPRTSAAWAMCSRRPACSSI